MSDTVLIPITMAGPVASDWLCRGNRPVEASNRESRLDALPGLARRNGHRSWRHRLKTKSQKNTQSHQSASELTSLAEERSLDPLDFC
jgi:hypothetical protein